MVTELAQAPRSEVRHIFASARKQTPELKKIARANPGRVVFIKLDVTDSIGGQKAHNKVKAIVGTAGLDVLINNAAANPRDRADRM
jgi:NAD(P)-dependent dehydrogenase (short-subunit alcohol dehydrogenase family)